MRTMRKKKINTRACHIIDTKSTSCTFSTLEDCYVVFKNDQDPEGVEANLEAVLETIPEEKLPKLSKHWEELTPPTSSVKMKWIMVPFR
ncbi:Hypothetical predicted protein [Paramuricea clavata]|uniref:Uncharacterized protein n=1 Tax=Paramuricea clavata TaxID=317549 RepID=A0A6S7HVD2_PARCT|nr:Hypothetical predicted protein [Paramuricea clavata]